MARRCSPLLAALLLSCLAHAVLLLCLPVARSVAPRLSPLRVTLSSLATAPSPLVDKSPGPRAGRRLPAAQPAGRTVPEPAGSPAGRPAAMLMDQGAGRRADPVVGKAGDNSVDNPPSAAPGAAAAGGAHAGAGDGAGCGLTRARYTQPWKPRYPETSRLRGEQGVVAVSLRVAASGEVLEVTLLQSSGFPRLDTAALAALQGRRLNPALRCGKPVESILQQRIPFRLDDD
jgi:protein TonB